MGAQHRIELQAIETEIHSLDLIKTKTYFHSNLDHPFKIQWFKSFLPYSDNENRGGGGVPPWPVVRELRFALRCPILQCDPPYAT
jgi:hypothetical protein